LVKGDAKASSAPSLFFLQEESAPMSEDAYSQTGLRIRWELRRRLEQEAQKNGRPLHTEMALRLARSLDSDAMKSVEDAAADLVRTLTRARNKVAG
jgi:hypothetical protein